MTAAPPATVAAAATRTGRAREQNEDSHLVDAEGAVFLVADGMGGHAAGEVASAMAVARVHQAWTEATMRLCIQAYAARAEPAQRRALFHAVREGVMGAHLRVAEEARRDPAKHGMGTTLTGLLLAGGDAIVAHAGDSRAYLVRDGAAAQLSEDHTLRSRLVAAGVSSRQARRGLLTSALGAGGIARVATFAVPLVAGDRFILCSDGVHEALADHELVQEVGGRSVAEAAGALVDRAAAQGGGDDATALVVDVLRAEGEAAQHARDAGAVARCALFQTLSAQERLRGLRIATPRAIAGALEPVSGGDRVAYVVLDGEVAVAGERLGPGALVYAGGLIEGTAAAREPATGAGRVLVIRRADFLELTEEEPDLGVKLYAALARLMAR